MSSAMVVILMAFSTIRCCEMLLAMLLKPQTLILQEVKFQLVMATSTVRGKQTVEAEPSLR